MRQQINHHWFRKWLVAWPVPSHYLNQCWNIVNWTLGNKIKWNLNRDLNIFIQENAFENGVWKMAAVLSRPQCVKRRQLHPTAFEIRTCKYNYIQPKTMNVITWLCLNTLRSRQKWRHFADGIFKCIFLNENVWIPFNNIPALVQIMACRQSGDKPLSEQMMISLLTHICVTRPQWVNVRRMLNFRFRKNYNFLSTAANPTVSVRH